MTTTAFDDDSLRPYGHVLAAALITAIAFLSAIAGWSMFARLDAAIVTYGVLHADSEQKTVEHLEGGILSELLVRAGDRVETGQVVARLDTTQTRELLSQLRTERTAALFAIWRLEAEQDGAEPDPAMAPKLDDPRLQAARAASERSLFTARLAAHDAQVAALDRRIDQLRAEIEASQGRARSAERQLALWQEERGQVAELVSRGAAPRQRLLEFERAVAQVQGDFDEHVNLVEAARQDIARAESEIRTLQQQRRVEIVAKLVEQRIKVESLDSRIRTAEDALARHALRAPQAGKVVSIATVTPGAIIGPGEPLMTILPENDELVALTQLPPAAIDSVHVGGPAEVRLTAYKRADAPLVPGEVVYVSADALESETGETYFEARVALSKDAIEDLEGFIVTAGMPVDVSIITGERRAGDYLLEPLLRHLRRAFREE